MNLQEFAEFHVARLSENENARFALYEAPPEIIPILAILFRREQDPQLRALILEAAWQHRCPSCLPLLREALDDPAPEVWQQALDGLVTVGGQESVAIIEEARRSLLADHRARSQRFGYFDEALQQTRDNGSVPSANEGR